MSRMNKEHILSEIRRTAKENGGTPLGKDRFARSTGIKESDWFGIFWARWSEATLEAGFSPNRFDKTGYAEDYLILKLIDLIRELGRFPVIGELRIRAGRGHDFPTDTTFRKLGMSKSERVKKVVNWCKGQDGYNDILTICLPLCSDAPDEIENEIEEAIKFGFVYLMKSGKHYKIGKSSSPGRRQYELKIQLPDNAELIHQIKTDDPNGIEAYWHNRFKVKRKGGEWFDLSLADVQAFKRRKFM